MHAVLTALAGAATATPASPDQPLIKLWGPLVGLALLAAAVRAMFGRRRR